MPNPKKDLTELEKSSLETHVILCRERHDNLSDTVDTLTSKIEDVNNHVNVHVLEKIEKYIEKIDKKFDDYQTQVDKAIADVKNSVSVNKEEHTSMLLKWAVAIIGTLITIICGLIFKLMPALEQLLSKLNGG